MQLVTLQRGLWLTSIPAHLQLPFLFHYFFFDQEECLIKCLQGLPQWLLQAHSSSNLTPGFKFKFPPVAYSSCFFPSNVGAQKKFPDVSLGPSFRASPLVKLGSIDFGLSQERWWGFMCIQFFQEYSTVSMMSTEDLREMSHCPPDDWDQLRVVGTVCDWVGSFSTVCDWVGSFSTYSVLKSLQPRKDRENETRTLVRRGCVTHHRVLYPLRKVTEI